MAANSLIKRISQIVLFAAAIGFFVYYGVRNWHEVRAVLADFDAGLIVLAVLLVTASLLCKALMNLSLLRELLHTPLDNATLLHSYTKSQIVKYIPGKIWGVVFQASSLENNIRKSDVWVVSVLQILIMNAFSVLVLMATIVFIDTLATSIKAGVLVFSTLGFVVFYFNAGRLLRFAGLQKSTLRKYARMLNAKLVRQISAIVACDWLLYIGMWAALAYGQLSFFEVFVTAVNYTTASIVGWLAFFLPNGLVVREAVFIAFGKVIGENISLLVVYSVVARMLFLAGDFLLFVLVAIYKRFNERPKGTLGADG